MPPHFPDLLGYQIPIIEIIRFLSIRGPELVSRSIFQEQGPHPVPLTHIRWKIFAPWKIFVIIEIKLSVDNCCYNAPDLS